MSEYSDSILLEDKDFFRAQLLVWYQPKQRPLPWKGIDNPYFIWLSEIILQQTRVEQGLPYYLRFTQTYPTVVDLAHAPEDEVLKLWEGLGYYSRARNLHAAAKTITEVYEGIFPSTYEDIRGLKGVGEYTAAAIASFAYGLPYAVVDGNVYRVLARFFGLDEPIDTTTGKNLFRALADELLDRTQPARYNQAIMDFGATHCMPKLPLCISCLHRPRCKAYQQQRVGQLPIKSKKLQKRQRYFYYWVVTDGAQVALRKREEGDVWAGLYDFPLTELEDWAEGFFVQERLLETSFWHTQLAPHQGRITHLSQRYDQVLSHQKISALFIRVEVQAGFFEEKKEWLSVERKKIKNFAFPKLVGRYLEQEGRALLE